MNAIKKYKIAILLCGLLLIPYIIVCILFINDKPHLKYIHLLCSISLFLFPLFFLKQKLFFILVFLYLFFLPFELVTIYLNGENIYKGVLLSIIQTNFYESKELLSSFIWILVLLPFYFFLYLYFAINFTSNTHLIDDYIVRKKVRLFICFFTVIVISTSLFVVKIGFVGQKGQHLSLTVKTLLFFEHHLTKMYPMDITINGISLYIKQRKEQNLMKQLQGQKLSAGKEKKSKEVYIFILGETARSAQFSLNGYNRRTNPNLENLKNLISFPNYFSASNTTIYSIPFIFTGTISNSDNSYTNSISKLTFLDAFIEVGFKTYWLSLQDDMDFVSQRLSSISYESLSIFAGFNNKFDGVLLDPIQKILIKDENLQIIILHTKGSHYEYSKRYPQEFNIWKPSDDGKLYYENRDNLVNGYDNSIYYTDFFISNIIKKLDSLNCIASLIYLSDHGENLFDDYRKLSLHANPIATKWTLNAPLIAWFSDEYVGEYKNKYENLLFNKYAFLNSSNIFHTIIEVADIDLPAIIHHKSFANEKFKEDSVFYWYSPLEQSFIYNPHELK